MEQLQGSANLSELDVNTLKSVFHFAIDNTNPQLLSALLSKFSEISEFYELNIEDIYGHTPLISTIHNNYLEGFEILMKYKIFVNYKTKNGRTALHFAAESHINKFLEKLIQKGGGNVNVSCNEGSVLHVAIKASQIENALFLLNEKDISLLEIDALGDTPLHTCIKEGLPDVFLKICSVLESYEDSVKVKKILNLKNIAGNTVLHEAVIKKRGNMLELLKNKFIANGCIDEKSKNKAGMTAWEVKKGIEDEEENQRYSAIEKKKLNTVKNREKQELRKKEQAELEIKAQEEEVLKEKMKIHEENRVNYQNKWGFVMVVGGILAVLAVMYLALNYLEKKKRENYIDD